MANLLQAVGLLGSSRGDASNAIVTNETFNAFTGKLFSYFDVLRDKRLKIVQVTQRTELANERRSRRIGIPEKVKEEVSEENYKESDSLIKDLFLSIGGIVKNFFDFFKGFLGKIKKFLPAALLALRAGLKVLVFALPKILPFMVMAGLFYFAKDIAEAFKKLTSGGETEQTAAAAATVTAEPELTDADFGGDGDDTGTPVSEEDERVEEQLRILLQPEKLKDEDFGDDETEAPAAQAETSPPPPAPKRKPTPPARPAAAAPPAPTPPAPPPAPPAPPTAPPKQAAQPKPGAMKRTRDVTPAELEASFDSELEKENAKEDAEFAQSEAKIKAKNEIDEVLGPKLDALKEKLRTETTGAFDPRYAEIEKEIDKVRKQIQDRRDIIFGKKESAAPSGAPEKIEDDFKIDLQPGAQVKKTETETLQETATETTTTNVTETGGGSTQRTSAVTVLSPEAEKLKAEHDKIEKEMREIGRKLMSEGMDPGDAMTDPRVLALAKRKREIGIKIDTIPRIEVSAASVTKIPGKNISRTNTVVVPIINRQNTVMVTGG